MPEALDNALLRFVDQDIEQAALHARAALFLQRRAMRNLRALELRAKEQRKARTPDCKPKRS